MCGRLTGGSRASLSVGCSPLRTVPLWALWGPLNVCFAMFATLRSTGASSCSNVCTTTTQESGNRRRVSIPAEFLFNWNVVSGSWPFVYTLAY